jgi:hypothetical protein
MFAGIIKRLKEAGYRNFYLPFYIHEIQSHTLTDVSIKEVKDTDTDVIGKLNFIYSHDKLFFHRVQGKNSYIPTFD